MQARSHRKLLRKSLQLLLQARRLHGAAKAYTHKKQPGVMVVVLGCFFNVAAALEQKTRDGMDDADAIEARKG